MSPVRERRDSLINGLKPWSNWSQKWNVPLSVIERNTSWLRARWWGKWGQSTSLLYGQSSEWLIVPEREVSLWGRCTGWALVHAFGAGALVLLFRAGAGGHCGGRGGGGAGLLLKVCYDHRDVPHRDGQLLGCAPVNVLQLGPGVVGVLGLGCGLARLYAVSFTGWALMDVWFGPVLLAVGFLGDGWDNFFLSVLLLFFGLLLFALFLVPLFNGVFIGWIYVRTLLFSPIFLRPLGLLLLLFLWRRRGGILLSHLLCHQLRVYPGFPGRRALPYITDAAFEGFGTVSESAHATVPKSVVRCRFGLSFWPGRALFVAHCGKIDSQKTETGSVINNNCA